MIRSLLLNKYLATEFFKVVLVTILIFFCLGFIMNLFEEMNYFKDIDEGFYLPILLTIFIVPSFLYNMLPFIILISGLWFFLKIRKTDEIIAIKVSGLSNLSVILIPSILSVILGLIFITAINPVTSVLVKKYETIKGSYEKDKEYLAAITENGIWIKERNFDKNNLIRSSNLKNKFLMNLTIYQFDENNNFIRRIEAASADISSVEWTLNDVRILDGEGKSIAENLNELFYTSMYDVKKIRSLYSNLDTISFWSLDNEIKLLEERGYSTREVRAKFQRSLAFPFFLLSMVFLSAVFTLGIQFKENSWVYVFIAIIASVLIFYFNDFSAALGKTEKLPIVLSVWMPLLIIFVFSSVGLIHANQK